MNVFGFRLDRLWLKKAAMQSMRLLLVGIAFGYFYAWASPRFYPTARSAGFLLGVMHGALMPMALPSLVLGKDVAIYAAVNTGRFYKLGYTIGINVCGLIFFGMLFAKPKSRAKRKERGHAALNRVESHPDLEQPITQDLKDVHTTPGPIKIAGK